MRSSYFDIDAILAEEELVPVTNLLDFSHLAHLDPDFDHRRPVVDLPPIEGDNVGEDADEKLRKLRTRARERRIAQNRYLPEGSRIKMPLWAMEQWATLGFVRFGLPRHFGSRARERLEADPVVVDLRAKNERFFMSGMFLVDLIQRCSSTLMSSVSSRPGSRSSKRDAHIAAMAEVARESLELKRTLLQTYSGQRLRRTFDWSISCVDEDVSSYTKRLTEMEIRLFRRGAAAARAHTHWKLYGSRRIVVSEMAMRAAASVQTVAKLEEDVSHGNKRKLAVSPETRNLSKNARTT